MSKLAIITMILLFVGIGLAYNSCNVSGEVRKPACPWACACQNNTICSLDNCTFNNCTCQELGANNNSSNISCVRNEPCPVNVTSNQITSNKEKKKNGRIFTMTLNCPRCT